LSIAFTWYFFAKRAFYEIWKNNRSAYSGKSATVERAQSAFSAIAL